jgi:WD40 repeat protein/serine/threonine protein kinase
MPADDRPQAAADSLDVERAVDRFEDAWQRGERPDIDAHLPRDGDRTAVLVELVHVDLERRLKAGEAVRVETYLRRYPELNAERVALDLVTAEYRLRSRREDVTAAEYGQRFPAYRDQLTALFGQPPPDADESPTRSHRPTGASSTVVYAVQPGAGEGLVALTARYRVARRHARGGLGEILVARDEVLHREVALKRLQPERLHDLDSRQRFVREAEITSQLEHPGVVPVYGLGRVGDESPVYAMRFIRGDTLLQAIERFHAADSSRRDPGERRLALQQLLQRFLSVCNTIGYAHSKGVLHRDIKPNNILLGEYGETLVVDWGLAKLQKEEGGGKKDEGGRMKDEPEGSGSSFILPPSSFPETLAGTVVGTPAYMSPEQAAGDWLQVGAASDVYSLGATLYCLLTGQPAFRDARIGEVLDKVRRGEFPPPRQVSSQVPPALEAICLKAMVRRPEDRYAAPLELARDVEQWLAGEPVNAWPEPLTARARRWLARHPTLTTVAGVALVAAAVLGTVTAWLLAAYDREHSERTIAEVKMDAAVREREATHRELERIDRDAYADHVVGADNAWWEADRDRARQLLGQCKPELRRWEWYHLRRCCQADEQVLSGHTSEVWAVTFSRDGRRLASASTDHTVRVWDAATGKLVRALTGHTGAVWAVAFSPDGRWLATGSDDQTVRLWDAATGEEHAVLQRGFGEVMACCFSPDGKRLAAATAPDWRSSGPGVAGAVRVWELASRKLVRTFSGHASGLRGVAFSPDGTRIASCGYDGVVKLWDARDGRVLHTLAEHRGFVYDVAFSPDGRLLASASGDRTARIWDVATGRPLHQLMGHTNQVWGVAFSPDGNRLASCGDDATIKVWDVKLGRRLVTLHGHAHGIAHVAFSPDGRRLASASDDQTVRLWDPSLCRWARTLVGHTGGVWDAAFSPDGSRLATAGNDRTVKVWDVAAGTVLMTLPCPASCGGITFSPDGRRLAAACDDGAVHLWDAATGREAGPLRGHTGLLWAVAFSPDGARLASASADKTVRLWDVATGAALVTLEGHSAEVRSLAFRPDGRLLASGGDDKTVRLWDVDTGRLVRTLGHATSVLAVAFAPDGKTLVAGTDETRRVMTREPGEIKLWDPDTGAERMAWRGTYGAIKRVAFSPDGKRLVSGNTNWMLNVWDAATGQNLLNLYGHVGTVNSVRFSPDGNQLVSSDLDGNVILWDGRPL